MDLEAPTQDSTSCCKHNTHAQERLFITRSVKRCDRHTRHRCKDDRLATFLILACDTILGTTTHQDRARSHRTTVPAHLSPGRRTAASSPPGLACCATSRPQTGSRM